MIKKIFFLLFLFTFTNLIAAQEHFYAFVMHATHDETYDHDVWQEGARLIASLVKQCEDPEIAFITCIDEVIKTIKGIVILYRNKPGLNIDVYIMRKPFQFPTNGLFINIDSALEEVSLADYNRIEALMADLDTMNCRNNEKCALNILEIVKPIVMLSRGQIWLHVTNLES